jgi:hypothetical protein
VNGARVEVELEVDVLDIPATQPAEPIHAGRHTNIRRADGIAATAGRIDEQNDAFLQDKSVDARGKVHLCVACEAQWC